MKLPALALVLPLAAVCADNTLTPADRRDGYQLLFDGKTMKGWLDPARKKPPGDAWYIEAGCLKAREGSRIKEDLLTAESYGDFDLKFDWIVSKNGNTGIKYRIQTVVFLDDARLPIGPAGYIDRLNRALTLPCCDRAGLAPDATATDYPMGYEFQLLGQSAEQSRASKNPRFTTGALYGMAAPTAFPVRGPSEWNSARLVVEGDHVEHWINEVKVVDASLSSTEGRAGIEEHWKAAPEYVKLLLNGKPNGPFALQHHNGTDIRFKNLKIRRLPAK